jgi:hypothetical protein
VATPNLEGVGHRVFGRDWVGLDPPRHLVLFTRRALVEALRGAGFEHVGDAPYSSFAYDVFATSFAARGDRIQPGRTDAYRGRVLAAVTSPVARRRRRHADELVVIAR